MYTFQGYLKIRLRFLGKSQFRDFRLSISKVDKQHFFQRTFPMYPTYYYRDKDSCQHKISPQQTTESAPFVDSSRNE